MLLSSPNELISVRLIADMSIRSSSEVEYWILLGKDVGYFPPSEFERLTAAVVEVRRMLFGLRKAIRNDGKDKLQ